MISSNNPTTPELYITLKYLTFELQFTKKFRLFIYNEKKIQEKLANEKDKRKYTETGNRIQIDSLFSRLFLRLSPHFTDFLTGLKNVSSQKIASIFFLIK